jgi:predicted transposase/invertase (TIGR01784 family)
MKPLNLLPLKVDFVFKYLFTNDTASLASLVNSILFPDGENRILEIQVISSEIIPLFEGGKRTFLDLKTIAKLEKGVDDNLIQIELQVHEQTAYIQRSLYYATGLIQNQLKSGDSYFQLKPTIQINILDFDLFPMDTIVSRFLLKEAKADHILTDLFQMVYVELSKFRLDRVSELKSEQDVWFYLLKNIQNLTEETKMEILSKMPDLKNAFDALELYASDPEKRRDLEERLRADKNFAYELAARFEKGVLEGEFSKALETAKKMISKGMNLQDIIEITGLTEAELQKHGIIHPR